MARTLRRLAVVGGGWAGLAAAVEATRLGASVTLIEMAPRLGGRARRVEVDGLELDNGQHILIGAYTETLALMRAVDVDPARVLRRSPLALPGPDGRGLALPAGAPALAFARAVLGHRGWRLGERAALLARAAGWALAGFRCDERTSVAEWAAPLPAAVRTELIEPLAVAALNTPPERASAAVFLRVLKDALFAGPGSADLLLPAAPLDALLPDPVAAWLAAHGAQIRLGRRVRRLLPDGRAWRVDDEPFDAVVLATTAVEASRLVEPIAPAWAASAAALRHEPIATCYLRAEGARLAGPMVALRPDAASSPAQFAFDLGALGREPGLFALVASAAADALAGGTPAFEAAAAGQATRAFGGRWTVLRTLVDRRATFACAPALARPPGEILPGLVAAGDYLAGPYPATLESAVRSGLAAARKLS